MEIAQASKETLKNLYEPPWRRISFIGIAGPSGSGKTSVARLIVKALNLPNVVILSLDSFYKPLTAEQKQQAYRNEYDFDSPDAIDWVLLFNVLIELKRGRKVDIPIYSFHDHDRLPETSTLFGASIIVIEGIFALYDEKVRSLLDVSVFLETDSDVCLSRRLNRDINYRGRDIRGVLHQYDRFVKPSYDNFVRKQSIYTDIIVPRGRDNKVAIEMVIKFIKRTLSVQSRSHRENIDSLQQIVPTIPNLPLNLVQLRQTPEIEAIKTILVNKETDADNMQFYLSRIGTMLMNLAGDSLMYEEKVITLHNGDTWKGLQLAKELCGVSVLGSGGTLETALCRQFPNVRLGKVLVRVNQVTNEPSLQYHKLPRGIAGTNVILIASQLTTSTDVLMATQILVDFGVPEENIIIVVYVSFVESIKTLGFIFPKVTIVTGFLETAEDAVMGKLNLEKTFYGC
ncbi:uridine kinase/uracil phosphoribosyltransferase [Schizosaccharomyces osmophilus]|uniref:Uridine kinase n=1 Tax=Schizosaccharomyces osmophilus TaxID=2545709 RepID=A0AAE9WET0_9SCHI|nr:uridine kinase/uracil phosphoribosyltransferase [Schizosaccharomyces osmophilus]WBW74955.1 uridine kinase/uracil phosphoribosyltransferase [Schizosaccharomyces osmophilus]